MKVRTWMAGIITVGIIVLLSGSLQAQMMGRMGMRGGMWNTAGTAAANPMGLTAEQMTQMQKLRLEHQQEMLPLRTKIQTKNLELRTLLLNTNRNQSDVDKINKELIELQSGIQAKMIDHQAAMADILTDEQKALMQTTGFAAGRGMGTCLMGTGMMGNNRSMGMRGNRGGGRGRGMAGGRGGSCMMGRGMMGW